MPRLVLVKHSLPNILPEVPSAEWHLSEEGRRRALALAERLSSFAPRRVFSSREPKAVETADIIGSTLDLPREIVEGLEEHWRPRAGLVSESRYEEAVAKLFARPNELVFGEETANQAGARFAASVAELLSRRNDQDTLVVAHGTVISLFVADRVGVEPFALWKELGLPSYVVLDSFGTSGFRFKGSFPECRILEILKRV